MQQKLIIKKFTSLLAGIIVFGFTATAQTTDKLFLEAANTKMRHSKEYTLKVARLMPEEKFTYRPTTGEMTFGEQLIHISSNLGWLSSAYLHGGENPVTSAAKKTVKKEEVIQIVNNTYDYAIGALEKFSMGQLKDSVSFFAGPMNKLQIINLINDHQTHHRGQLLVYLRLNGIKPPDYVGW
jgi:uncharacterized damage-inducible protein DinB